MKRLFTWIALGVMVLGAASCNKDAEINARLNEQDAKIKNIASDVNNLKDLFNQLKDAQVNGYFILDVEEVKDGDTVVGWKIKISNGKTIILMNGKDGKDGKDGEDGSDGSGAVADVSVSETADAWTITVNGESVTIPKAPEEIPFSIRFSDTSFGALAGKTVSYPFTVSGLTDGDELSVAAYASAGYTAVVNAGKTAVDVTAPDPIVDGQVIVFAANGKGKADMKALSFTGAQITVADGYQTAPAPKEGGVVSVDVTTNVSYTMFIPVDWIHYDPTKAWMDHLTFTIDANPGLARSANIGLRAGDVVILNIPIQQAAGAEYDAEIEVGGTTAALTVTVGEASGDFAYLKTAVAATVEEALAIIDAGNGVKVEPGNTSSALTPTVTGTNKVTFRVYNSSDQALDYNYFTVFGLSAEDAAFYCGTYEFTRCYALSINNRSAWVDLTSNNPTYVENGYSDAHIVIAPSPYIRDCLLTVPDFFGFGKNASGNKSITEEVLIPRNAGYSTFVDLSPVTAPEYALPAEPMMANDVHYISVNASIPLFAVEDEKFYLTRSNSEVSEQLYFQLQKEDNGDITLIDDSNYYNLVIVSQSQKEAFVDAYKGDTSTIFFQGGENFPDKKPVAVKKATE